MEQRKYLVDANNDFTVKAADNTGYELKFGCGFIVLLDKMAISWQSLIGTIFLPWIQLWQFIPSGTGSQMVKFGVLTVTAS